VNAPVEVRMRRSMSAVVLSLAVLLPRASSAQGTDEPVQVNGLYFYPTREFRIFDANVMTQVASSQRSPVYIDSTLAPNTVVYVPTGGKTMRAYRVGEPAAATASTAPAAAPVGTSGSTVPTVAGSGSNVVASQSATAAETSASRGRTLTAQTALKPDGNKGIWIEYAGARYYADGAAAVYSANRFTQIGEHRGFPVYRAAGDSNKDRIWLTSSIGGPVAPFVKR
jgi:hypothetical protein